MKEAIELALRNVVEKRGGPFGAVVVKDGVIVGRGTNQVTASKDPTAHAEIVAIRQACQNLGVFHLDGCEIYTSCEPCPMCLAAIYWAHLHKIYYANTKEDAAEIGFDDQFIYDEFAKSLDSRKIPAIQIMREEALEAFRYWENQEDKVEY
ncbi:MAG: nucleoside deaminase [Planctomycetota bacterium]|nr:MAG: nucleoside deaminase [Planctomycetota bacterium]